jgi:hypothetical protein
MRKYWKIKMSTFHTPYKGSVSGTSEVMWAQEAWFKEI